MTSSRVRVSVGATIPTGEPYDSLRIELGSETDVSELSNEAETRKAILQQLTSELNDWKTHHPAASLAAKPQRFEAQPLQSAANAASKQENTTEDRFAPPKIQIWRKSLKRANLETILISEETLRDPLVKELYDRLKEIGSMKSVGCMYKLSVFNNQNFIQRWTNKPVGV